jgi:L-malate glycosyltransferase
MQKIKIAYITHQILANRGGTEKQLVEIIHRLDKSQFEPWLICLIGTEWFRQAALPCSKRELGYCGFVKANSASVILKLARIFKKERFDILQCFSEEPAIITYAANLVSQTRPIRISSHRDIGLTEKPSYHTLYDYVLPRLYRSFDGALANGSAVQQYTATHFRIPIQKIRIIYNGIDTERSDPCIPNIFLMHPSRLKIGIAANLNPVKRLDVFVDAMALLITSHGIRDFQAFIIGDGPERSKLVSRVKDLKMEPYIHFVGSVPNVADYLAHLDIGVLCSSREGFSNSILEYMTHALPVVATDVGGNRELVDATNGFLVPPNQPAALAHSCALLAKDENLRKQLAANSRTRVEYSFSWQKTIAELQQYYQSFNTTRKTSR